MSVPAAYIGVILIWSTTPLAIKWSSVDDNFLFGVSSRMTIGVMVALLLVQLMGKKLPRHKAAVQTYLVAGLGIFGAMLSVYWAAQFIPSGWISVIFGLSPIVTGMMSAIWLGERFTGKGLIAMLLGLVGLAVIFNGGLETGQHLAAGIAGVLLSTLIHSASAVWIKRIDARLPGLTVTTGGLSVAVPLFLLTWFLSGNSLPADLPARAGLSILYLGIIGSVLGFALYFYVLKTVAATSVSMLALITPVSALLLGHLLNDEGLTANIWLGTGLISLGLLSYQWGHVKREASLSRS